MVEQVKPPTEFIEDTAHENVTAPTKSFVRIVWRRVLMADLQLQLLRKLKNLNIGTARIEEFLDDLEESKKSKTESRKNSKDEKLLKNIMERKVADADIAKRDADGRKARLRTKIDIEFGKNTRRKRTMLKKIRNEMTRIRKNLELKNKEKVKHLLPNIGKTK